VTSAYLNNILVPSELDHIIDEVHEELKSLGANESTHGDRFKKLKGHDNLYSLRLNDTARLLFLHINRVLILVDKFEKHREYERKLKNTKLTEHYLKHFGITSDVSDLTQQGSRYLVKDLVHPWTKSTRQRAKCFCPDRPASGTLR